MSSMLFSGYDQFQISNPPVPKFLALRDALDKAERAPRAYARSAGTAVTYWTEEPEPTSLVAHRTYQTIIRARESVIQLLLAQVSNLVPADAYDDTTDSQRFDGTAEVTILQPGEFLAVAPNEAWAFASVPEGPVDVFRLTVAGPAIRPLGPAA